MSEELSVTGESLQLLENTDMCEACGDKLRFMGKKVGEGSTRSEVQ